MSEYQYYEFVALDCPISDEGMAYARGCSKAKPYAVTVGCLALCLPLFRFMRWVPGCARMASQSVHVIAPQS